MVWKASLTLTECNITSVFSVECWSRIDVSRKAERMWRTAVSLLATCSFNRVLGEDFIAQEPLLHRSSAKHLLLTDDLIEFHKNLTQIESITYNEQEVGQWLAASLKHQGYTVEKQYIEDDSGRFNVFAYPGEKRETDILVSSHIDTVRAL